jgi:NAD+ kinase
MALPTVEAAGIPAGMAAREDVGMQPVRRIGVLVHPSRDTTVVVEELCRWSERRGGDVYAVDDGSSRLSPGKVSDCDVLIAAGGDGTVLRALHRGSVAGVAVLGVNLGRLGFLAEIDVPALPEALERLSCGDYQVEPRHGMRMAGASLSCEEFGTTAFNDVVFTRVPASGQSAIAVAVNGDVLARWWGDGVIVATPTGSTAYSFAAGGPIVSPRLGAWVVTPLAPPGTFHGSFVLSGEETVTVDILPPGGQVAVELDGRPAGTAAPGDVITLTSTRRIGQLVRLDGHSFYHRARRRLQLSDPPQLRSH